MSARQRDGINAQRLLSLSETELAEMGLRNLARLLVRVQDKIGSLKAAEPRRRIGRKHPVAHSATERNI